MTSIPDFVNAIFAKYDSEADGSGSLNIDELKEPYQKLAVERPDLGLTNEGYPAFFAKLSGDDGNSDGKATKEELIAYLESINYVPKE